MPYLTPIWNRKRILQARFPAFPTYLQRICEVFARYCTFIAKLESAQPEAASSRTRRTQYAVRSLKLCAAVENAGERPPERDAFRVAPAAYGSPSPTSEWLISEPNPSNFFGACKRRETSFTRRRRHGPVTGPRANRHNAIALPQSARRVPPKRSPRARGTRTTSQPSREKFQCNLTRFHDHTSAGARFWTRARARSRSGARGLPPRSQGGAPHAARRAPRRTPRQEGVGTERRTRAPSPFAADPRLALTYSRTARVKLAVPEAETGRRRLAKGQTSRPSAWTWPDRAFSAIDLR
jgi:hypothetical protein